MVNGQDLGNHPYGYTSFWYDITDKAKPGEKNIIAVQVKNEGRNSRWYSGSGIYRIVWLKNVAPVHVAQQGTFITTPVVNTSSATVNIKTNVQNGSAATASVNLITRIKDAKGIEKARTLSSQDIPLNASYEFNQNIMVSAP